MGTRTVPPAEARILRRTRWKLVAWSAGSTLVVLTLLGSGLYLAVERQLRTESEDRLQRRASEMTERIPVARDGSSVVGPGRMVSLSVGSDQDVRLWSFPVAGVADPGLPGLLIGGPASGTIASIGAGGPITTLATSQGFQELDVMGIPMRVLTDVVEVGGEAVELQVAADRTVELGTLQATLLVLLVGGAASILAAGGLGYRYAGRALVPIRDALRHQREFAADASHELRTPLTVIRSNVEALRRGTGVSGEHQMLDDIDAETDRMTLLVDQLLLLARTDSGAQEVELRPVDLGQEATDALEPLVRVAQARHVSLALDVVPAAVSGDATRLRQLVAILVDNAVRHAPFEGHVWVRVTTGPRQVALTVDDDGRGVRPDDRARVFDRFWRAPDAPAGGSGLGLAIATWIVDHHGGHIEVTERPGGGARFQVRLPVA